MGLLILILLAIVLLWLLGAAGLVYGLGHPKRKTFVVALAKGDPTDPADLGLKAQEVTFTLSDKTRTPGWVIEGAPGNVDGNDSAGITVVIVHGFGDSRYGSLVRAPLLVPYVKKVVVFDLPGQGEAEAKRAYGGLREPDDVLAVLDQLEPNDAKRIVLLGASMGAGISIVAAAEAGGTLRGRIVGVIAEGPYRHWDEPLHNLFKKNRYPRWPIIDLAWVWLRVTAKGFADFDRARYAGKLSCPLLVLHGTEDRLCPITSAKEIAEAAADGRFVEIVGGEHGNLPCEHEADYIEAVGGFIKSLCPEDGSVTMGGLAEHHGSHPREAEEFRPPDADWPGRS